MAGNGTIVGLGRALADVDRAADLALVEAIARLGLVVRRAGGTELRLRDVPPELRALLDLVGLADVVGLGEATPDPDPVPERDRV